ncbi:aminoacyl-tRNA hydrolase [Flavihumibacter sp. R14]|nr:aminoacyl-tRNA hydrolase [Flavihumibacter soli]
MLISKQDILREVSFKTSRSGGKGGQNVNKVSSKVELNLDVERTQLFSEEQKQLLKQKLRKRINSEGILQVITEEERSQYLNKERSLEKLIELLGHALHKPKLRKATKPGKAAVEKRLKNKLQNAMKKINRKGLEF